MFLDDLDLIEQVQNIVKNESINAEYAVARTGDNMSEMFANMDDEYMRGRAADVLDVCNRVVSVLQGAGDTGFTATEPSILLADDLAPSETVQLDKSLVLSFVTRHDELAYGDPCAYDGDTGIDFRRLSGRRGWQDGYR